MYSLAAYDKDEKECIQLKQICKDMAALLTDDYGNMDLVAQMAQFRQIIEQKPLIDMMLYDVTMQDAMNYLPDLRKEYLQTQLMIIADLHTSPMEYMKPGIMASSLLLRPWTEQQAQEVLKEFMQAYIEKNREQDSSRVFVIESKEGKLHVPYEQIYFFEAREKKIYVCAGKEEYGFYDTIDNLESRLPDQFIRCHRGFIVNRYKIRKVMISQGIISLIDDFEVPLSRSYKPVLKELGK